MPLPGAGTSTAFLSSVRPTHCSTSRASRSISSSDFSGYVSQGRISSQHVEKMTAVQAPPVGPGLTVFVDDFLDLFIEVLPTFDQGL